MNQIARAAWVAIFTLAMCPWAMASDLATASEGTFSGAVVASRGDVGISVDLLQQKIATVPSDIREGILRDTESLGKVIDSLLLTKQLARAALQEQDQEVDASRLPDDLASLTTLAESYMETKVAALEDGASGGARYEALARERYLANRDKYSTEKRLLIQRIDVSTESYGEVAAKLVADDIRTRLAEALRSSEDIGSVLESLDDAAVSVQEVNLPRSEVYETDVSGVLTRALHQLREQVGISDALRNGNRFTVIALQEIIPPVRKSYEEVHAAILADLRTEHIENFKVGVMRSFSMQPVELNYPVIQDLIKADEAWEEPTVGG